MLLDTSIVIRPPADGLPPGAGALSAITVAELRYGVDAVHDPLERALRQRRLGRLVAEFDVIEFDLHTADAYGLLANLIRAAGRNPRPRRMDLLIAATAVRHGLALVTRNPDDFRHLERILPVLAVR